MSAPLQPSVSDIASIDLRVRYAETDQMGVVYHSHYLIWCEIGRTEAIRQRGVTYAELEKRGVRLAVSDLSIRYHAPARYDNLVRVDTRLAESRSRTVTFEYSIANVDTGQRLVTARTVLVSLDAAGRAIALPADVRRLLAASDERP